LTATQWAAQAPYVPGTDYTRSVFDKRASTALRATCAACGKVVFATAMCAHRCAKPKMTEEEKAAFDPDFDDFFQPKFAVNGAVGERPDDTYVEAAQAVWLSVTRQ
jgi:hypothetical protein